MEMTKIKHPDTCKFRKFVKSIPMAICGLALGLAALGNLLQSDASLGGARDALRLTCGALAFVALIIYIMKIAFDFRHAKEELKTPVPASVLPTATMAIMLLCAYLRKPLLNEPPIAGLAEVATALWYTAVVVQVAMMVYFIRKFLGGFKLAAVFPSWFIVFVGIVVASVTAPLMNAVYIGQAAFYVGFVFYFVCLVLVVTRMVKIPHKLFVEPARPTIAIFTAPMSLLVVGYFNSFVNAGVPVNKGLLYFMLAVAALTYLFVLAMLVPILLKRFYPSYSSFTFPFVISAIAFRMGANFLAGVNSSLKFLTTVADVTQWIAVAAVLFVIVQYVRYFIYWIKY